MKLLIPIDGSAYSGAALALVAAPPVLGDAPPQIDLLNVQLPVPQGAGRAAGGEIAQAGYEAESGKVLDPVVERLQAAGFDPAWFHRVGHSGVVIADWVEEHGVDRVVMGSHGRGAPTSALPVGSVAWPVAAKCSTPLPIRLPR